MDAADLESTLRRRILGSVRLDPGTRAAYAREHAAFLALQPAAGEDIARVSERVREGALELPEPVVESPKSQLIAGVLLSLTETENVTVSFTSG